MNMFGLGKGKGKKLTAVSVTVSETGLVRRDNQDTAFVDAAQTVFCVADGMGGGAEGATASRIVCEELAKTTSATSLVARMEAVNAAIRAANGRILAYAKERSFAQMGSTVVVLLFDPADSRRGAVCHIGDSRIYRVRRGRAEPLTKDHTVGEQLSEFASGEQAVGLKRRTNPLAHVLTRVVGAGENAFGDWRKLDLAEGDAFLVCSDGVHDVIADSRIGEILSAGTELPAAANRLRDEIVGAGAPDNFSFVMVRLGVENDGR